MHSVGVSAAPVLGFSFAFLLPWLLIQRPARARTVSAVFDQSWMRMCRPLSESLNFHFIDILEFNTLALGFKSSTLNHRP